MIYAQVLKGVPQILSNRALNPVVERCMTFVRSRAVPQVPRHHSQLLDTGKMEERTRLHRGENCIILGPGVDGYPARWLSAPDRIITS